MPCIIAILKKYFALVKYQFIASCRMCVGTHARFQIVRHVRTHDGPRINQIRGKAISGSPGPEIPTQICSP